MRDSNRTTTGVRVVGYFESFLETPRATTAANIAMEMKASHQGLKMIGKKTTKIMSIHRRHAGIPIS